ncbi:hypothetical protein [Streptomyces sp. NPDC050504]|uniref:hypothetical protein n=1 Tax=Streptomyces sp. NPDC050504 TaxID=3365618 RepID=UPI00378BBCBB
MSTPLVHPAARAGAGLRLLRATVFTAVCVVLSATGHVLAACAAVPWWTLLVGFVGMFAVVTLLAGRERSLGQIVAAMVAGQLALHALFGVGQRHAGLDAAAAGAGGSGGDSFVRLAAKLVCGAGPAQIDPIEARRIVTDAGLSPAQGAGHTAHQASAAAGQAAHQASAAVAGGVLPSLSMVLGHLLAALVTGWLLRRGEVALFRVARLSAASAGALAQGARLRALRTALALVRVLRAGLAGAPRGPRAPRTALDAPLPSPGNPLQHAVTRRGPPARAYRLAA